MNRTLALPNPSRSMSSTRRKGTPEAVSMVPTAEARAISSAFDLLHASFQAFRQASAWDADNGRKSTFSGNVIMGSILP